MSMPSIAVIDQVSAAMSLRSLQHEVIASNVANRDAQGYQRMKLQFDGAMDRAGAARIVADDAAGSASLEDDLVALSSNSMRYQALAGALSRYFSIVDAIANPNKG